jgi:hypothetical protein
MATLGNISITPGTRQPVYDITVTDGQTYIPEMFVFTSETGDADWEVYVNKNVNSLAVVPHPTIIMTPQTTGGTIPRSTSVFVRITCVNAAGESRPSDGWKTVATGSGTDTNRVDISWGAVSGATSYNVYIGSKSGGESFFGDTTGTSISVTEMPTNDPMGIPTLPDIFIFGVSSATPVIPITGIKITSRLQIFVTLSTAGRASVSIPLK